VDRGARGTATVAAGPRAGVARRDVRLLILVRGEFGRRNAPVVIKKILAHLDRKDARRKQASCRKGGRRLPVGLADVITPHSFNRGYCAGHGKVSVTLRSGWFG
jgi:hypothetical protein